MALGDKESSAANGAPKTDKNKTEKAKQKVVANGTPAITQNTRSNTTTDGKKKTAPASLGAPPNTGAVVDDNGKMLKELTETMKMMRNEMKEMQKEKNEREKADYFFPPTHGYAHAFDEWDDEPFHHEPYHAADEYNEGHADDLSFPAASAETQSDENVNKEDESEKSECEQGNFDQYLAEFITPKDKTCPPVFTSLAKGVNKMFDEGMEFETFKKKAADIPNPENCTSLHSVVNVDTHVQKLLKHNTKKLDERLKTISTAMVKAGQCFTRVLDGIQRDLTGQKSAEEAKLCADTLTSTGMKGMAMLGHGFHSICLRRRELQKPDVAWKYETLFASDVPHNKYLYGGNENVEKMVKDVNNSLRMRPNASAVSSRKRGYHGYYGGMMRGRGRARPAPYPSPYLFRGGYAYGGSAGGYQTMKRGQAHRGRGSRGGSTSSQSLNKGEVSFIMEQTKSQSMPNIFAGRLKQFLPHWEKITSDEEVLQIIRGCTIEFVNNTVPIQTGNIRESHFNAEKQLIVSQEIKKLLDKQVLEIVESEEGEFISTIFLLPKKNGSFRMILNLKEFNEHVEYYHFKMETFEKALKMISGGSFLASIDIKDAYYCVAVHEDYRKYLRFLWRGQLLQFTCVPNGLSCAPRKYTKMMKPVYALLRTKGHSISGFIDDSLIVADSETELQQSVDDTLSIFESLGLVINREKSVLSPNTRLKYLGYEIDTIKMLVTLPQDKVSTVVHQVHELLHTNKDTIRNVAKVIGSLIACFPAVEYGPLHYRVLEKEKINALKLNKGDYDSLMIVSAEMQRELTWWKNNLHTQFRRIVKPNPNLILTTDASLDGWGSVCETERTGGRWAEVEQQFHINYLELLGAYLAIQAYADKIQHIDKPLHVQIRMDNTTAISYINNMGGKEPQLNTLACRVWNWCIENDLWVSATHIPGVENTVADYESRHFNDRGEWSLDSQVFQKIEAIFGKLEIDLFASRINTKCSKYVAWRRDPQAVFIDAFSRSWTDLYSYIFPPFSLIDRVLQKIRMEEASAVVIVPLWPTQPWFATFLNLLDRHPIALPMSAKLLTLEFSTKLHPLRRKLRMIAGHLSGRRVDNMNYQAGLQKLSPTLGKPEHANSMQYTQGNGQHFVLKNSVIVLEQMLV